MKTFRELVECLACKAGEFFFTLDGPRAGVSQKRIPREMLTLKVRDWTSEWSLPIWKFVEYLLGVCIKCKPASHEVHWRLIFKKYIKKIRTTLTEGGWTQFWLFVSSICYLPNHGKGKVVAHNLKLGKWKILDERFWLTGKMWRLSSFHGNMNDWIQP